MRVLIKDSVDSSELVVEAHEVVYDPTDSTVCINFRDSGYVLHDVCHDEAINIVETAYNEGKVDVRRFTAEVVY